jgi:excisionase family DNA binding protein
MASLTATQAAELTGKNRSTIIRAIEKGHLSASKDSFGHYLLDPAELERVYGTLRRIDARDDATRQDAPPSDAAVLAREVELLREMIEHERQANERERAEHADQRRTWEEERAFLRSMLERASEQVKLLTDQREMPPRPGFWQRVLRRA